LRVAISRSPSAASTLQDLLDELYVSLADCSTSRLLKRLGRLQPPGIDKVDIST
jgi:hypothetical protein